jgi:hypothetical protein
LRQSPGVQSRELGPRPGAAIASAGATTQSLVRDDYLRATDLRAFVERHRDRLRNPEVAFYVSQALEECALTHDSGERHGLPLEEQRAAAMIADQCRGFEGEVIHPATILELLRHAARWGEPRAEARLLLLRDAAAPKDDALPHLPWMLTLREPSIVRDVGAFLSRGEAQWRYGGEQVPTAVAAIAWELVACDLDPACTPRSRFALAQCAYLGRCSDWRYEDAVATFEPPELMSAARRLREGILRALRDRDWEWLGLD